MPSKILCTLYKGRARDSFKKRALRCLVASISQKNTFHTSAFCYTHKYKVNNRTVHFRQETPWNHFASCYILDFSSVNSTLHPVFSSSPVPYTSLQIIAALAELHRTDLLSLLRRGWMYCLEFEWRECNTK